MDDVIALLVHLQSLPTGTKTSVFLDPGPAQDILGEGKTREDLMLAINEAANRKLVERWGQPNGPALPLTKAHRTAEVGVIINDAGRSAIASRVVV